MTDNKDKKNFKELEDNELDMVIGGVFERVERKKDPSQSLQPGISATKMYVASKGPR